MPIQRDRQSEDDVAVRTTGTGPTAVVSVLKNHYLILNWTHTELLPESLLKGFRVAVFTGSDPNDVSKYLCPPKDFGASVTGTVITVNVSATTVINSAVQSLYMNGNESSWRLIGGTVSVDPDTFTLATSANLSILSQQISDIADDGLLSKNEKPAIVSRFTTATSEKDLLVSRANSAGIGYSDFIDSYNNLIGYLQSLTPAYDDVNTDTIINKTSFWGAFENFEVEKLKLTSNLAGIQKSVDATCETNVTLPDPGTATFNGVTLTEGKTLMLVGQTVKAENGIYTFHVIAGGASAARCHPSSLIKTSTSGILTNAANAYDNNVATAATLESSSVLASATISGWSGSLTAGDLIINALLLGDIGTINEATVGIYYSLDAGVNWVLVDLTSDNTGAETYTIPLTSVIQSNLRVKINCNGRKIKVWEDDYTWFYEFLYASAIIREVYFEAAGTGSASYLLTKKSDLFNADIYGVLSTAGTYAGKAVYVEKTVNNDITLDITGIANGAGEPNLGLPPADNYVLVSSLAGVRSWGAIGTQTLATCSWVNVTGKPTSFPPEAHIHTWANISSKPTTIAGFGITDASPAANVMHKKGTTAQKPTANSGNAGFIYYDTTLDKIQLSEADSWVDFGPIRPTANVMHSRGTTAQKPTASAGTEGYLYFDTTLNKLQMSLSSVWTDCEGEGGGGSGTGTGVDVNGILHVPVGTPPSTSPANEIQIYADYTIINIVPVMTSNTLPSGEVSSSGALAGPWTAFDDSLGTYWTNNAGAMPQWIQYKFPSAKRVVSISMTPYAGYTNRMPTAWILKGSNNGSTWVDIDTITGVTGWVDNVAKTYVFTNANSYAYYRLHITANGGDAYVTIAKIELIGPSNNLTMKVRDDLGNIFSQYGLNGDPDNYIVSIKRDQVTHTTASITHLAMEQSTVLLPKTANILNIATDKAARVRLYLTAAKQSADSTRLVTVDPSVNHGMIFEVVTTASALSIDFAPIPVWASPLTDYTAYITVENLSGSTGVVATTIKYTPLEL